MSERKVSSENRERAKPPSWQNQPPQFRGDDRKTVMNENVKPVGLDTPAAPQHGWSNDTRLSERMQSQQGLTKREYAAIALRLPVSGCEELDAMIWQARRWDAAEKLLPALVGDPKFHKELVDDYDRTISDLWEGCTVLSEGFTDALSAQLKPKECE